MLATITFDTDTTVQGYGVVYAGTYTIEIPSDYDPDLVTAEDMVTDPAIRTVRAYRYSSDDLTIAEIAQAHGLRAATAAELEAAFRGAGGYITVTDADGALVAHVPQ